MLEAFLKILPIFFTFLLGYGLKKTKYFNSEDGGLLLKLVFFVGSPALTYLSVSKLPITSTLFVFPLIAAVTMLTIYAIDLLITRSMSIHKSTLGAYLVGTLIANTGFAVPFLLASFGNEAIARVAMFDLVGGLLTFTFIYSIAVQHGDKKASAKFILQKVIISPPLWGLFAGLIANYSQFETPILIDGFLKNLSNLVSPLIMISLGLYFSPKLINAKLISFGIITRVGGGIFVGYILSQLFGLNGIDKVVAIVCAGAPIGFNTLTFSNMEKLDIKFASSLVSVATAFGLVYIPLIILFFSN